MLGPHPGEGGQLNRRITAAVAIAVLSVAAACSGGGDERPSPSVESAELTPAPPRSPVPRVVEGTAIPNGRHSGYLRSVDMTSRTVTFDQAYMLGYDEANQAAARAGGEYPVPNDYYIQNLSSQLWKIKLADDVSVKVITECCDPSPIDLDEFARLFGSKEPPAEIYGGGRTPYWITIEKQRITSIEQQFVP